MTREGDIYTEPIRDVSKNRMSDYVGYTVGRSLPNVYDGLKTVQRRILYNAYEKGHRSNKQYVKSAKTTGECVGDYHPHGDTSVYQAQTNLIKDYSNNQRLLDGHGNYPNILENSAAAARYTEMRLNKFSEEVLLAGTRDGIVDMVPTFDESGEEPVVLPAKVPLVLINGATAIGAGGFASEIPPHSIESVIASTQALLADPTVSTKVLVEEYGLKPSFPYGSNLNISKIVDIYTTGGTAGNFTNWSTIEEDESDPNYDRLIITDLPYNVTQERITGKIKEINTKAEDIKKANKGKKHKKSYFEFTGMIDMEERSSGSKIDLHIIYEKGTNLDQAKKELYDKTDLKVTIGFNPNLIMGDKGLVEYTDIKEIILDWIGFRKETVRREKMKKISKLERRIHILEAIITIFGDDDNLEYFLELVRGYDKETIVHNLEEHFSFNPTQTDYLVNTLRISSINVNEVGKFQQELQEKEDLRDQEIAYLRDPSLINDLISEELEEIRTKNYLDKPKKETIYHTSDPLEDIDLDSQIPDENYLLIFTKQGMLKKIKSEGPKVQGRNGKGLSLGRIRDGDAVLAAMDTNSRDTILLATDQGKLFRYQVHELPTSNKLANLGKDITNMVKGEEIIHVTRLTPAEVAQGENLLLVVTTNDGYVKAVELSHFIGRMNGMKLVDLRNETSSVISLEVVPIDLYESQQASLVVVNEAGLYARYKLGDIPIMGRTARGNQALSTKSTKLVGSHVLTPKEDYLLVVTTSGKGKLVEVNELNVTNRPSKGQILIKDGEPTYTGICTKEEWEDPDSNLMLVSNEKTITIPLSSVNVYSKTAKGTNLKSMDTGEALITGSLLV